MLGDLRAQRPFCVTGEGVGFDAPEAEGRRHEKEFMRWERGEGIVHWSRLVGL